MTPLVDVIETIGCELRVPVVEKLRRQLSFADARGPGAVQGRQHRAADVVLGDVEVEPDGCLLDDRIRRVAEREEPGERRRRGALLDVGV